MELSPKQQAVNEIKNAKRVLVLGHRNPDGDQLGSLLALKLALIKLEKNVDVIITDKISGKFKYLTTGAEIKTDYKHTDGKILRIDTKRIPIQGMKWQRDDDFLNIYLDTDKNLKFEFIEIINGMPKPDLIIVVDTPSVKNIDLVYENNTPLFFEVPLLNIDHHPGNEYFGTINLVDLTATSTAEILVSLFEALGIKIDTPDMATCLLTGILYDTQSFRGQNTTPKSLTVAAQLLAAGGRQQEIVKNLYGSEPKELLGAWEAMLRNQQKDSSRKIVWTKLVSEESKLIDDSDIADAAGDLLAKNADCEVSLIIYQSSDTGKHQAVIMSKNKDMVANIAGLFGATSKGNIVSFEVEAENIEDAEKIVLKRLAESWKDNQPQERKELWGLIEPGVQSTEPDNASETKKNDNRITKTVTALPNSVKEKEDAIEEALKSISQAEKDENNKEFVSLRDVIDRKKAGGMRTIEPGDVTVNDFDVFEDE